MTPGQLLLLQQIRLVATLRGWTMKKTIKKARDLMNELEQACLAAESPPNKEAPPSKDEAKLIEQAEQIIKDMLSTNKRKDKPNKPDTE